jgi:fructan beta-fructosidase
VKELLGLRSGASGTVTRSGSPDTTTGRYIWKCSADPGSDFSVSFSNEEGERLVVGYEKASNRYYIDRSLSGRTDFNNEFAKTSFSPRISREKKITMTVVVDESSVEIFADGGLTVMSCVVFPQKPLTRITTQPVGQSVIEPLSRVSLRSIW